MLKKIVFYAGWLLSPLTFWNDLFINLPLSYICANVTARLIPVDFLLAVLIFYWLSNALGLYMMYAAGKAIFKEGRGLKRTLVDLFVTMALYSLLLILISKIGLLKPIQL